MLTKFSNYETFLVLNEAITGGLDQSALNKIRRCFTQIITNYGFFAELLFNLNILELGANEGCKTMCTDGKSIGYWPPFVHKLTEAEVVFVIIHEIMHNANFHFSRQGNRDQPLWNRAADYAINIQIDDMKNDMKTSNILSPPKDICLDEKYRGMGAEQIYDILEKQTPPKKPGQPGQGQPGQGSQGGQGQPGQGKGKGKGKGQGSGEDSNEQGEGEGGGTPEGDLRKPGSLDGKGTKVYEGNKELDDVKTEEELEKKWQDIRNNAAVKNAGSGSSSLDRWLRKVNKPKINWRAELRKFVAQVYDELDYAFFNKRFIGAGDYLPGPKQVDISSYQNVVIAIDTSGSIGDDTLAKFASEMMKLFKQYSILSCYVIWCDADIPKKGGVQKFDVADKSFKLDKLKPVGGGGTSFHPPFKWIQDNLIKKGGKVPAFMIYFTDAYGDAPTIGQYGIRSYANRVLWVVTENDNASNLKFGKKIYIDKLPG
jgi:predicted metal-dependent peptidase